jgi:hypothetical protein
MPSLKGDSTNSAVPGVRGENTAGGDGLVGKGRRGVVGTSDTYQGVYGKSVDNAGVVGESDHLHGVFGVCHNPHGAGIFGTNDQEGGFGVQGISESGDGVIGRGRRGVVGESDTFQGVYGRSRDNAGVVGESDRLHAVFGVCHNPSGGGLFGTNDAGGAGVIGLSPRGEGVHGESDAVSLNAGVFGIATNSDGLGPGVSGESRGSGPGVLGRAIRDAGVIGFHGDPRLQETTVANDGGKAGVFGASESGAGVLGYSRDKESPGVFAFGGLRAIALDRPFSAVFDGDVQVNGDIFLPGADCAENFDIGKDQDIDPGSVVVLDEDGLLRRCNEGYDRKVAGVISGGGSYAPAVVMDSHGTSDNRRPVALVGKVFCKIDATYGAIGIGDLLTTSPTPGHAMRATDPLKAFGAVIGKALGRLETGSGLLPILVCLQ